MGQHNHNLSDVIQKQPPIIKLALYYCFIAMQIQKVVDDTLDMTDHGLFITWWHNVHVFKVLLVLAILVGLDRHLRQTFPLQADEDDR
jgi:hypothetical protein